jgi:hypothetical protein
LHCGERIGWMFSRAPRALFGVTARLRFCPYCGTSLDELREGNPAPAADSAVWNRWTKSHWRILGWSLASAAVILLLLGWIAYPEFRKAKRRSLASHELEELRMLDSAVDQYAIETGRDTGFRMRFEDLKFYLKAGTPLYNTGLDQFGNDYGPFTVDTVPRVPNAAATALSDVASPEFWSPYK